MLLLPCTKVGVIHNGIKLYSLQMYNHHRNRSVNVRMQANIKVVLDAINTTALISRDPTNLTQK